MDAGKITLTEDEKKEIGEILDKHMVKGGRYTDGKMPEYLWG